MKSRFVFLVACTGLLALSACGDTYASRGLSGAAIGAGAAAVTGAPLAAGAVVGAGAGMLTK